METAQVKSGSSGLSQLLVVVLLVVVGALAFFAGQANLAATPENGTDSDERTIASIAREEQVVLLSLGIQGIAEKNERSTFLGVDVPGSGRATFLQYSFNAKLGIEGKDVDILPAGEKAFRVTIPEFIFIGHDNPNFKLAAEDGGVLSWITPEADTIEMINGILNAEAQQEYIASNEDILKDQATVFYTTIVDSIDPSITLIFDFGQDS